MGSTLYNSQGWFTPQEGNGDIIDITRGVQEVVQTAGIDDGLVNVFVAHSTAAIQQRGGARWNASPPHWHPAADCSSTAVNPCEKSRCHPGADEPPPRHNTQRSPGPPPVWGAYAVHPGGREL